MRVARDPDVHILVELVGGTAAAKDFLLEAIRNGKSVVTANKALLAECGPEIVKAVQAAGVDIGFEASVGGGIPIIRTLRKGWRRTGSGRSSGSSTVRATTSFRA